MFNFEQKGETHSNVTAPEGAVAGMKQPLCYLCSSWRVWLVTKKLFRPPD